MALNNSLAKANSKSLPFTVAIQGKGYQNLINNTLKDPKRAARFVTAITSAVSTNPALQDCDAGTVLSAGLLGEGLNLSPSPQLGQYYLVPFNDRKNGRKVAQFQLGYKGYIQLAIRSGQYKKLNVLPIKEGELIRFNPLEEDIEVKLIEDEEQRENAPTTGYYAMFEYTNGFRKAIYWSRAKMESHAEKYSMGYKAHKGYTFWEKDFDGMACKTMLRQLISKWGIMSIELERAVSNDMAVINEDGTPNYIDVPETAVENQPEQVLEIQPEPIAEPTTDDFTSIMEG
jgi:recombination protein RecT